MSKVLPNLYIGNYDDATNHMLLHANDITHILNCAYEIDSNHHKECFKNKKIHLDDASGQRLMPHIAEAYNFVDKAIEGGGIIIIHCAMGISRSVSTAIYYLMRKYNMTYDEALHLIQRSRSIAQPNQSFEGQLRQIQTERKIGTPGSARTSKIKYARMMKN